MMKSTVRTMVIGVFGLGRALDPGRGQVTGRVLTTSVVAIVALAAAGCGGAQRLGGHERMGGPRYTDPAGWSVQHPGLTVEHSGADMRASVSEVTFASFVQRPAVHVYHHVNSGGFRVDPPFDRKSGRFPADGIALRIVREDGGPRPNLETPETGFPIRLADFAPSDYSSSARAPRARELTVTADGNSYLALAWAGQDASAASRRLLDQVVASLSFPSLRPGTTDGEGFQVFLPVDRYPLGMFLRVRVAGQPFWLVRAPGGFYTVGWREQTITAGYKSRCDLRLDSNRHEFSCTNMRARWGRVGRVITRPADATFNDPLNIGVAKPGWDGHLLITPDEPRFAGPRYTRQLWPDWHSTRTR